MAKFHLGIDPEEWDALPWHRQRMYAANLRTQLRGPKDEQDYDDVDTDDDLGAIGITFVQE